jgi:hypothetical protein
LEPGEWELLILNKINTSGEAAGQASALNQAVGEGLGAHPSLDHQEQLPRLVNDTLRILHGARSLPSAEAVAALLPFVNTMRDQHLENDRFAHASAGAVGALVQSLEAKGFATDDLWEEAIEASLSFANASANLSQIASS